MRYGTVCIHPPEGASMAIASHVEELAHTDTTTAPSTRRFEKADVLANEACASNDGKFTRSGIPAEQPFTFELSDKETLPPLTTDRPRSIALGYHTGKRTPD